MDILVIGSGGREHALSWKLAQSDQVDSIYVAPGNAGTAEKFQNVAIDVMDTKGLVKFAKENEIDLVVVGPEDPLTEGLVDTFELEGIKVFGPNQAAAQFEKSKNFTKGFLLKYDIPTAAHFTTSDFDQAIDYIQDMSLPIVIKADGLCQGKGVLIAQSKEEAKDVLKDLLVDRVFGDEGAVVVIEDFLQGVEQSLLCLVSHNQIFPLESAQDYKKAYDNDEGENTGGMGAVSPSPLLNDQLNSNVEDILNKIETGLNKESFDFTGILFIGFMVDQDQPKVLEFNVRFGDPETEVLMPRLESDLADLMLKAIDGNLEASDLVWSDQACVCVVLASDGYPGSYQKGLVLKEVEETEDGVVAFHNGTARDDQGRLISNGGRVITPAALSPTIEEARLKAYQLVDQLKVDGLFSRSDIAK